MHVCRCHPVVLDAAFAVWLVSLILGVMGAALPGGAAGSLLGGVLVAFFPVGTALLGWKTWQWWMARYVFTNERVLFITGILERRVRGLPLRMVLDTDYHRTFWGRVLRYGDVELNLSGQPGLRTLEALPDPQGIYQLLLSLMSGRHPAVPPSTGVGGNR